jgi:hypothetical protein
MNTNCNPWWTTKDKATRADLRTILAMDPFEHWEFNRMPESSAEERLRYGLRIFYSQWNDPDGRAFFEQTLRVADRALHEEKYKGTEFLDAGFPKNRGRLLRARAYAAALLGQALDENALRQASIDCAEYCKILKGKLWDSQGQANYLAAVRLALVAGDQEQARQLMKTRKSFRWHFEEFEILRGIIGTIDEGIPEKGRVIMQALLEAYFNKIRDPHLKPDVFMETDILRLELGAIRDKYFVSPDGIISWPRVIEALSA